MPASQCGGFAAVSLAGRRYPSMVVGAAAHGIQQQFEQCRAVS